MARRVKADKDKAGYDHAFMMVTGLQVIQPAAQVLTCKLCKNPLQPTHARKYWACCVHFHGPLFSIQAMRDRLMQEGGCATKWDAVNLLERVADALQTRSKHSEAAAD